MNGLNGSLRSRVLWNANWLRAALEAAAGFLLCFFLLLALQPAGSVWLFGLFCATLGCAVWCGLRIRPSSVTGYQEFIEEAELVLGVTLVLTAAVCIPVYGLELLGAVRLGGFVSLDLGLTVFTIFSGLMYGIIRIGLGATAAVRRYAENPQGFSFIRRTSSVRAGLEGVVASIALFFLLAPLLLFDPGTGDFWAWSLLITWIGLAIGFTARAQLPSGKRWKIIFHELALLAAANGFYFTGICLSIILLGWIDRPGMWWFLPPAGGGPGIFALFITVAFVLARGSGWMGFLIDSADQRRGPGAEAREAQPRLLFFFRTGFWRAALEGMAGTFLLSWAVLFDPLRFGNVFLVVIPGIFLAWCALRLQLTSGPWPKKLQREIGFALAYGVLLSVALCAAVICLSIPLSGQLWEQLPSIFLLSAPILALVFGVFRAAITLIHVWRRFQRRSMVLSLTNAILSIIFAGIALIAGLWSFAFIFSTDLPVEPSLQPNIISQAFYRLTMALVPLLGVMVLLFLLSLLFILPPAILFSYLVARSNTRRIRELADAAGAMRGGDYSIQVPVKGEDEVARLQADFNAMASDLGRTVREVQTERDRVAGLLQSRRELIAGVSHELRTPVATIRAHLESARRKRSVSSRTEELTILDREVIRLQSLIEELFTLSQAEVNKLTLDLNPVDAGEIVRERVAAMAPLAWQPGRVQVTAEIAAGAPRALADRMRLEQSLTNLIHNGVRHTPPGGVVVVAVTCEKDSVRIDVRDSGEGIAAKDLPNIWDRFFQGKSAAKSPGSGLGLALVKDFAEAMGGSVAVESEVGRGSCFTIRLPQA
jgi:signal transduction histidine kinase